MNQGEQMVKEAAEKAAEMIRGLGLTDAVVTLGDLYSYGGHPRMNVHARYVNLRGEEIHRSVSVERYFENPVGIYTCGWFPEGMYHNVIEPLRAMGYRASI